MLVIVFVGFCVVLVGSNDGWLERGERDVVSGVGCWGKFCCYLVFYF